MLVLRKSRFFHKGKEKCNYMNPYISYEDLIFKFHSFPDERGLLTIAQENGENPLPFKIGRVFWISDVPQNNCRGKHAHQTSWELIVAIKGNFNIKVDCGNGSSHIFLLNSPQCGIIIPPLVWCELYNFSSDAVCLCMASGDYNKEKYISDYNSFLQLVKGNKQQE